MVYCAADNGLNQFTKSDVAFPHQVELKANLDEVKANLRGLKNKPGTTRPADVTNYIRKKPGYPNNIVMTYALTQKASTESSSLSSPCYFFINFKQKFYVLVNLVQRHPIEEMVAELKARKTISKEQVMRESKNNESLRPNITFLMITSEKQSRWFGDRGDFKCHVIKMPSLDAAYWCSMSLYNLYT